MAGKIKNKRSILVAGFIVLIIFFGVTLFRYSQTYPINISQIENIDGIPFPVRQNTIITEKLAHADVYIPRSKFGRALTITTTFKPLETQSLFVGIRENSFWLSYPKFKLCCSQEQLDNNSTTTVKTVTIPISDKIIDSNNSLDLMFFSTNKNSSNKEDEGIYDKTNWILEDITVLSSPATPNLHDVKDYVMSKISRERPL